MDRPAECLDAILQTEEPVGLRLDGRIGEHPRRLLEGGGGEPRVGRQRGLGDAEDDLLERRGLADAAADVEGVRGAIAPEGWQANGTSLVVVLPQNNGGGTPQMPQGSDTTPQLR